MTDRPDWFDESLYPFASRFAEVEGARVHYLDEGTGPVLLMLHGNPTWSFLYRKLVVGLRDQFRCIAVDYPGFGLSTAPTGYGFTAAEHAKVVAGLVDQLGLDGITPIVQDWGGPIGMAMAVRHPDRFQAFIIGNTWAWPLTGNKTAERFSSLLGGERTGKVLVDRFNVFVNVFVRRGMRRRTPTEAEMRMWRGPFPTRESRLPVLVFPREIVSATPLLREVEQGLGKIADKPALLLWADKDVAFRKPELERFQSIFFRSTTYMLRGAGHYWQDDAGEEAVLAIKDWWRSLG